MTLPAGRPSDTHPVFNDNALKLGTFATNINGAHTVPPEVYAVTWPESLRLAEIADAAGLELVVPVARLKGYLDDAEHRSHVALDTYTWAAGIGQATQRAGVFATSHVSVIHPVLAAKQAATVDHISGGRFGLNVVAGWVPGESAMFGAPMGAHDDRYAQAEEWLEVLKRLWSSEEPVDFEGRFYRVRGGVSRPQPLQRPAPPLMNAGSSPTGRRFAAKHFDIAIVILGSDEPEECRAQIASYRDLAWREYRRNLQVWSFAYVIQGDTAAEAEAYERHLDEHTDGPALDAWMQGLVAFTEGHSEEYVNRLRHRHAVGAGGFPLVGTADRITDTLVGLSRAGLDGMLLSWVDFADGLPRFVDEVLPRLEQAGVRAG